MSIVQVRLLRALLEADADISADIAGNFVVRTSPAQPLDLTL